ncbi:MAG TPA: imidazolonepropionase [Gemmatimonadaceae bacterium]|nr:imidazolonepropionase [Gemmatimonadaceae bacterium]
MSSPEGAAGAARAERELVFVNARQVVTCAGPPTARRGAEMSVFQVIEDGAVAVRGERIAAVGPRRDLEQRFRNAERVDCASGIVTPALVDSHTHAIFGAPRANEHEMRAAGLDYMEIARRGGGIHSSVRDVRGRTESDLLQLARKRVRRLSSFGVGTIEMKSGYGLTLEDELKMLRVIRALQAELPVRIVATFLGAHEIPLEHRHSSAARREYVDALVHEMIPRVTQERLATFADVFCEPGVYTIDESREVLTAARAAGLRLKLHADELTSAGGAELAAELEATSADHLAAVSDEGIKALASVGTVATLLPSTMLFLGKPGQAPARRMIAAGLPIALATDFNPGTSPTVSLPLVLTLGVSQLRLTAAEAIVAATINGAAALDLAHEVGQLAPGYSADIAIFDVGDFKELPYWLGARTCRALWTRGKACDVHDLDVT